MRPSMRLVAALTMVLLVNLLGVPSLASTASLALVIGLLLSASAALVDRRLWVRAFLVLGLAQLGLFVWLFFGFARLPAPTKPLERASDFTLADQLGRSVTLSAELSKGPVLLVFFRGHW